MCDNNLSLSSSPSPNQTMSENSNSLVNSFIITNGLFSCLSNGENCSSKSNEKKSSNQTSSTKSTMSNDQKKPFKKLDISNCDLESDATLLKLIPELYERFIEVVDSATLISCQIFMCKSCRCLLKKNSNIILSHICKQKDIEKFSSIPILNNQLVFRSKPKNRATPIWNEFQEVVEPVSNQLLGYARCKRCFEIIKTVDPKSIPACLRKHVPLCPHEFPSSALVTSNKSSSSLSENHYNSSNSKNSINKKSSSPSSSVSLLKTDKKSAPISPNNVNNNLNNNETNGTSNLNSLLKELSSNSLLNAMKNLTNLNGLNLNSNLNNNLNSLNNLNNFNSNLNSSFGILPMVNNLVSLNNLQQTSNINSNIARASTSVNSTSSKLLQLKNEFRERCIELCYKELVSLETIRSPAFKRLCQTLVQMGNLSTGNRPITQVLPDTSQLQNQLFNQYLNLRSTIKKDLQTELNKNMGIAMVCDSQDDFCILATYYINKDWKLKEVVLSADAYGNEINGFITNALSDYQLNEEDKLGKFTFVSRGGHFHGVTISLTSIAHSIDQIINSTIFYDDTYTDIIENCRLVCNELSIEVKLEPIVENVDWITKYEIMKNVLINVDKYELKNYPLNLDLIEFLVNLLKPFRNASYELRNCSTYPTLNHVLLWYYKIMKLLEVDNNEDSDLDEDDDDRTFIRKTKKSIRDAVEELFVIHPLHKIAVFLWPNFRSLKMLNSDERESVHTEIREILNARTSKEELEKKKDYSMCSNVKKARTDFADWEEKSPIVAHDEIQRYINETLPNCDETTILLWWQEHQTKFPKLAQLAKWILSIPASVVMIEKFKLQNSPKMNEEILFLHCNLFDKQKID